MATLYGMVMTDAERDTIRCMAKESNLTISDFLKSALNVQYGVRFKNNAITRMQVKNDMRKLRSLIELRDEMNDIRKEMNNNE